MKSHFLIQTRQRLTSAFTLVEIMVSLAVLTILLLISAQVIGQVQSTWSASNARVSQFREARTAFDILTRNLSQATLNTYIDYDNNYIATAGSSAAAASAPTSYVRNSDLQFICGPAATLVTGGGGADALPGHAVFFQAPLGVTHSPSLVGLDRLLCARGYFVQYTSDESWIPAFIPPGNSSFRYRLMEYSPPAEKNLIYPAGATGTVTQTWFSGAGVTSGSSSSSTATIPVTRPVADNIVALIISPRREMKPGEDASTAETVATGTTEIATNYQYDSTVVNLATTASPLGTQHLLPPLIRVVLVAVDERSAKQLELFSGSAGSPPLGNDVEESLGNAYELESELADLVSKLQQRKLNYRVFSATVQLRGAKWSI
jgi:uncharacterized protein (TIGR02599 family)